MREMHTCIVGVPEIHLCKPGDISPTCTDGLYLHGIHQQAKAGCTLLMAVIRAILNQGGWRHINRLQDA
jgi:hypothetical protein